MLARRKCDVGPVTASSSAISYLRSEGSPCLFEAEPEFLILLSLQRGRHLGHALCAAPVGCAIHACARRLSHTLSGATGIEQCTLDSGA